MTDLPPTQPPGWYYAEGDPPGTQRYWDGTSWQGGPSPVPGQHADSVVSPAGTLAAPAMRVVGRLIDIVIWIVIWFVSFIILLVVVGVSFSVDNVDSVEDVDISTGAALAISVIPNLLVGLYELLMTGLTKGTVGKLVLGLKVVNEDGSDADMSTAARRLAIYAGFVVLSAIAGSLGLLVLLGLGVAGLIMIFVDSRHQTPWDKVAKSLVVER